MAKVNVHEAKTHLSRLLSRVEGGEEIVIAKAGRPIARIIPLAEKVIRRTPGTAKGRVIIKKEFFTPLPKSFLNVFER